MKAIAKNCSDENIRNVVYKRAKDTILVRYIEFVREKPLKALGYYTKIQRLIKKEKVFNYSKSARGSLLYLILKSIGKQYFPSMFNCYINIKKILKI